MNPIHPHLQAAQNLAALELTPPPLNQLTLHLSAAITDINTRLQNLELALAETSTAVELLAAHTQATHLLEATRDQPSQP